MGNKRKISAKASREYIEKRFEKECLINRSLAKNGEHKLVLILDHLKAGFNIGKIFRTAEAFSLFEIHIIGTKFFDPVPAKGALKKVKAHFFDSFEESFNKLKEDGYSFYAFESKESDYLHKTSFPEKSAFILGHEEFGVTFDLDDYKEIRKVKIQQWGPVESLNVSIAASIASYEYMRTWGEG